MFARTIPLSSLKRGFLPQIHQPLPLGKRESQQLLDSITTSFRKNLDREHPWETPDSTKPDSTENNPSTDHLLRAILTDPLFSHLPDANGSSSPRNSSRNDPFDVFNSAVSRGLMDCRRATGFLLTVQSRVKQEIRDQNLTTSPEDLHKRMGATGAGLHVLRWLRTSGQESDLDFLAHNGLVKILLPFMFAEGLQEVAYKWMAQLASQDPSVQSEETRRKYIWPLSSLMATIIRESSPSNLEGRIVSLDESYAALAKVNEMLPPRTLVGKTAVKYNWSRLSWVSTVTASERPKPSVRLFENFVEMGRPLNLPLDIAHLDLYHPTSPTHSAAIEYLRSRKNIAQRFSNLEPRKQQRVLCLVLDASERLKKIDQISEVPWLERLRQVLYDKLDLGLLDVRTADSLDFSHLQK